MPNDGHYEKRSALAEAKLAEVCKALKDAMPPSMGFAVLVYDYTVDIKGKKDHGFTFYASTSGREETADLMEEHVKYLRSTLPKLNPKTL